MKRTLNEKEQELLNQIRKSGLSDEEINNLPCMYNQKTGIIGVGKPGDMEKVKKAAEYNNKRLGLNNHHVCTLGEYLAQ